MEQTEHSHLHGVEPEAAEVKILLNEVPVMDRTLKTLLVG